MKTIPQPTYLRTFFVIVGTAITSITLFIIIHDNCRNNYNYDYYDDLRLQFLEARGRGHIHANLVILDKIWNDKENPSLTRSWFADTDFEAAILAEWLTSSNTYIWLRRGIMNMDNPILIFHFFKSRLELERNKNQYDLATKTRIDTNISKATIYFITSKFRYPIDIGISEDAKTTPEINAINTINKYHANAHNSLIDILYRLEHGEKLHEIDIK